MDSKNKLGLIFAVLSVVCGFGYAQYKDESVSIAPVLAIQKAKTQFQDSTHDSERRKLRWESDPKGSLLTLTELEKAGYGKTAFRAGKMYIASGVKSTELKAFLAGKAEAQLRDN